MGEEEEDSKSDLSKVLLSTPYKAAKGSVRKVKGILSSISQVANAAPEAFENFLSASSSALGIDPKPPSAAAPELSRSASAKVSSKLFPPDGPPLAGFGVGAGVVKKGLRNAFASSRGLGLGLPSGLVGFGGRTGGAAGGGTSPSGSRRHSLTILSDYEHPVLRPRLDTHDISGDRGSAGRPSLPILRTGGTPTGAGPKFLRAQTTPPNLGSRQGSKDVDEELAAFEQPAPESEIILDEFLCIDEDVFWQSTLVFLLVATLSKWMPLLPAIVITIVLYQFMKIRLDSLDARMENYRSDQEELRKSLNRQRRSSKTVAQQSTKPLSPVEFHPLMERSPLDPSPLQDE